MQFRSPTLGNRTQTITNTLVTTLRLLFLRSQGRPYTYDAANRLTAVNGVPYTWDANGNLLNDGSKDYVYDQANRLTNISANGLAWSATYNGDGARLRQVTNGVPTTYTLDLNAGLVQVLAQQDASGTTAYLYGVTRIGEQQPGGWAYHLSDALGSVRQLVDDGAQVTLARGYMPYGEALWSLGDGSSEYGYTGEDWNTTTQLVFLRARYMQPGLGMFLSHDPWDGDTLQPLTLHGFNYVEANPTNHTDPSGQQHRDCSLWPWAVRWMCNEAQRENLNVITVIYRIIGTAGGGLASEMMNHFLSNTGTDVDIPAARVLQDPQVQSHRDTLRDRFLKNRIEPLVMRCEEMPFGPELEIGESFSANTRDIFYAMGGMHIEAWYEGTIVDPSDNSATVNLNGDYFIDDPYDWHGEDDPDGPLDVLIPTPIGTLWVPDEWAEDLVDHGRAAEFVMHVRWTEHGTFTVPQH